MNRYILTNDFLKNALYSIESIWIKTLLITRISFSKISIKSFESYES